MLCLGNRNMMTLSANNNDGNNCGCVSKLHKNTIANYGITRQEKFILSGLCAKMLLFREDKKFVFSPKLIQQIAHLILLGSLRKYLQYQYGPL